MAWNYVQACVPLPPQHYHHDLARLSWVGLPASTELIYRLIYNAPARTAWWNPCQSTHSCAQNLRSLQRKKLSAGAYRTILFFFQPPLFDSLFTGLLLKYIKYTWRGSRPSYPSFNSLLSLCLYHHLMYFNCWLVYCPPPCTRMWVPWRQGFVSLLFTAVFPGA